MRSYLMLWLAAGLAAMLPGTGHATAASAVFRMVTVGNGCVPGETTVCLDTPLLKDPAVTVRTLLSEVYPDLGTDGRATHFAGGDPVEAASDPDGGLAADRPVDLATEPADVAVLDDGKEAYAAAVSSGVVAIAALKPAFRPLGRLYVATDPGGPTTGYRLLSGGPGKPLAVTSSGHFNSQEQYQSLHVVGGIGGDLVDLLDGPYLYSIATATDDCDPLEHRETVGEIMTLPKARHGLADLEIAVDHAATCTVGDRVSSVAKDSFRMRFGYDGVRYAGSTNRLDRLNTRLAE